MKKQKITPKNDYYLTRSNELNALLEKSQSSTSRALIEEAVRLTNISYGELEKVLQIAEDKRRFYESNQKKFDNTLSVMNGGMGPIKAAASNENFSTTTRIKIREAYDAMMEDINSGYEKRTKANKMMRDAIAECSARLKEVLLEKIYKPDSSVFVFDSIIAIFKSIVQSLYPFLENAGLLLELSVSKRKKDYLSSGDKLLSYLEDYNAILNSWLLLCNQFEKEVLS